MHKLREFWNAKLEQDRQNFAYLREMYPKGSTGVGSQMNCPVCRTKFVKKNYQQKFCGNGTKCKDTYHNLRPDRLQQTRRFS